MLHELKIDVAFADAVVSGDKTFEVRKNDRGFQKGDHVRFQAVEDYWRHPAHHKINSREYEVTYVLSGWGLKDGYVVFGMREVTG